MKNLMTQKIVLGMLMALVLAFSVQGIAEALTLTAVSDAVQSIRPGETVQITFQAGLKSPTQAYDNNTPRRRVNSGATDETEGTHTIDAQGYIVSYATNGRAYRQTAAELADLMVAGNAVTVINLAVDPRPSYQFISVAEQEKGVSGEMAIRGTVTIPLLVNTSGQVVDSTGKLVYDRTRAGTRYSNAGTPETDDDTQNVPYLYTLVDKEEPNAADSPVSLSNQFDYNDEQITISSTDTGLTLTASDGQVVFTSGGGVGNGVMSEKSVYGKLKSRVTLSTTLNTAGTYTVTITDSTDGEDRSRNDNQNFAPIAFTIYVTTETPITTGETPSITIVATNTQYQRVDTEESVETVSHRFSIAGVEDDARIRYKVAKGSGTLYVGTPDDEYTTPVSDLSVHKDASVYLKTNGTTNEVSASVAGSDRRTFSATIVYEYSGSGGTTTPTPTRTPTPTPTPRPTAPSLTLVPSTLSGAPGASVPLTAIVNNQIAGVTVTFSINGIPLSQVATNSLGQASTSILLPASNATVTASASGYSTATASISVTGAAPETPAPVVSEPASIEIYDGDDQEGEINQRLDEDLVVQVLDRNNNGVSFELVRFRIVEGRGRISPSSTRTDRDGLADVTFTPRSQGTVEIEAYTGDLSPVIFTVNVGEPPDAINKISGDDQSGRPGTAPCEPVRR